MSKANETWQWQLTRGEAFLLSLHGSEVGWVAEKKACWVHASKGPSSLWVLQAEPQVLHCAPDLHAKLF